MQATSDAVSLLSLAGRTVLVAESEPIIALDLDGMLREFGCVASGFVSSTVDALALLQRERPDAALINPVLRDGSALPFILALCQAGVPFALVSGHKDNSSGAPALQEAPRLDWPYGSKELQRTLRGLLEGQGRSPKCEADAWAKPGVHLVCGDCDERMQPGEGEGG